MLKKMFCFLLCFVLLCCSMPAFAAQDETLTLLFTHDIHDYYYSTVSQSSSGLLEHGGAARLMTLIQENRDENTLYLDAGDFSMGTLFQSIFTDAFELRVLGLCGCDVTTLGNHEFDYGASGVAEMLRSCAACEETVPQLVQANLSLTGELTQEQKELKEALDAAGVKPYTVIEKGGHKIGVLGLMGYDSIECVQSDVDFDDYIETAKKWVPQMQENGCDLIIVLSHTGTSSFGEGEDAELARAVPDIDIIVSGHTHSAYREPALVGDTVIVCCGEYLSNLGKLTFTLESGKVKVKEYRLLPVDSSVTEEPAMAEKVESFRRVVNDTYLSSSPTRFDTVICRSSFDMIPLNEMYATHQEYTTGDLIADAYLYAAEQAGITDIDVALVGLGTIRGSIRKGDITTADAFEICSLGVGADGSAGHPIVSAWITGRELKLLCELDASLGPMVSSIKMSYAGLSYTFNTERTILDRVTDIDLVRKDGTREKIENNRLYRVAANMYAINMLGMLNDLTKGILAITPLNSDGTPVTDLYKMELLDQNGNELKEWAAFRDYLMSFDKDADGVSLLPQIYAAPQGRKIKVSDSSIRAVAHPGAATPIIPLLIGGAVLLLAAIVCAIVLPIRHHRKKKKAGKN